MHEGLSFEAARRAAGAELGSRAAIKDNVRDVRAGAFVDAVLQDTRFGARLLRRNPVFAATAALSLAIGIGATNTIFTVADAFRLGTVSYPNYRDIRERASTLSGVYAYSEMPSAKSLGGVNGRRTYLR